jgi:hypothetical protein
VRERGLEPLQDIPLDPKSSASTSSATLAQTALFIDSNQLTVVAVFLNYAVICDYNRICNHIAIYADFFGNLSKIIKQFPFNVNLLKCGFMLPVFCNLSQVQ